MPKGDDILERLIEHSVAVLQLCNELPKGRAITHIGNQLIRSGSAAAPNYAEARAGESRQDFIHKLGIVLKELNESLVWLRLLRKMGVVPTAALEPLINECDQLCRIVAASVKTASGEKH
jgi:four helix bundle protein